MNSTHTYFIHHTSKCFIADRPVSKHRVFQKIHYIEKDCSK